MKTNKPGKHNLLFLHFEKIIFGALILVTLCYCYSATSLPRISWSPNDLTNDATQANSTITNSTKLFLDLDKTVQPYDLRANDIRQGIPYSYYALQNKWEPPVFSEKIRRANPTLFSPSRLTVTAGVGGILWNEAPTIFNGGAAAVSNIGGSDMGGFGGATMSGTGTTTGNILVKRWVMVTGLIPYKQQLEEYVAKYSNAMYSQIDDMPTYIYFEIQRNEIGDNDANGQPNWKKIDVRTQYFNNQRHWVGYGLDPVDIQYTLPPYDSSRFPAMASPLPPLSNRTFGREAAYPPYIPVMADSLRDNMIENLKMQWQMLKDQKPIEEKELFDITSFSSRQGGGLSGSDMGGLTGGGMGGYGSGMGSNTGGGMGGYGNGMGSNTGGGMGGYGGDMSSGGGMNPGTAWYIGAGKERPSVYQQVNYCLFRYFDFDVESNKSYRYKVRLAVKNPNLFIPESFLDEGAEKTKRDPFFWTEFSEPSSPATALATSRVLVQDVDFFNPRSNETSATITSIAFDEGEKADYILKDQKITPGTVLNFFKKSSSKAPDVAAQSGMGGVGMGTDTTTGMSGTTTAAKPKAALKTLDHLSGECVLDVIGKRRLAGTNQEHVSPGQIMLMGFDGTVKLQSAKLDKQELSRYEKKQTTDITGM
ncbi:MAG: hypothetical protein LBT05_06090 [Planctomycetaceae bacterium]|jgi:hypothetical protein|nr:hypothetical protein [Planctomycetaceae bacterium]